MRDDAAPVLQCFVGVGLLIVAWRFAPGPHSDPMLYVLSGVFAFSGAMVLITGMSRANANPSPLPGRIGRVIWALRPRTWMVAWAALMAVAWVYGTPHLRWQYTIGGASAACDYIGWTGVQRWAGSSPDCTALKMF